jgi:hypothetical protein
MHEHFEEIFCQKGTITPSKMALSKLNCNTKRGDVKKKVVIHMQKNPIFLTFILSKTNYIYIIVTNIALHISNYCVYCIEDQNLTHTISMHRNF